MPNSDVVRCLAGIGTFSYSIYLWHTPVRAWGIPIVGKLIGTPLNWFAYEGIYLAGVVIVGVIAAKIVEYLVLRVCDRLYPVRDHRGLSTACDVMMALTFEVRIPHFTSPRASHVTLVAHEGLTRAIATI
jgi:peptidoglycan/LPS O-acetylase OafA/YrhL